MLSLTEDSEASHAIFGQGIGYLDGVGGPYRGTANTPQGPGDAAVGGVMAATDGEITAFVSAVTTEANEDEQLRGEPVQLLRAGGLGHEHIPVAVGE